MHNQRSGHRKPTRAFQPPQIPLPNFQMSKSILITLYEMPRVFTPLMPKNSILTLSCPETGHSFDLR